MNKVNKKLLPFRSYSENDVVNEYSLDQLGEYGMFVKVSRGDLDDIQGEVADNFGASFDRSRSPQWGAKNKITPTTSGDTKYDVLGVTLWSTLANDENGQLLKFDKQKREELYAVISGDAVPVATKGRFLLGPEAFTVTGSAPNATGVDSVKPSLGDVVVPSNTEAGKVDIVPTSSIVASPSTATEYGENQILGKVIATGAMFSGTAEVILG
jgi:hypothetical protein